jgi:hypothetical protein
MDLRALAARDEAAPPFGFDEFERRHSQRLRQRRATVLGLAGSMAALGLVALLALVTQAPEPVGMAGLAPVAAVAEPAPHELPALVDLGQFEATSEIEDHIALLDAEISVARVHSVPVERLREMESTRAQLNDSLQRVSYAHSLLSL